MAYCVGEIAWIRGFRCRIITAPYMDGARELQDALNIENGRTITFRTHEEVARHIAQDLSTYDEMQAGFRRLRAAPSQGGKNEHKNSD